MKTRGTYALLALFFAGLVGLWAADFARLPTRKQQERMSNRILYELLDTKPDDLRKIEIHSGEEVLVFERREKGNGWQMTSPINVAADPSKVETLAYNLKELSRKPDAATLEGDPATYGLASPSWVVRLWGTSTQEPLTSLEVGKLSLDRRYVRHAGSEGAEVVDARSLDLLKLAAINWRDHEMFRVPSMEVDAVHLAGDGKELQLRRGRDAWRISEPIRTLAVESKVEGLIADLGTLKVLDDSRFVANDVGASDLERYGLKTPTLTIEVEASRINRRREPQILHVGKPVEGKEGLVYARQEGQDDVVALDTRVLKTLKPDPNAYRSPKVADINLARVARVGVEEAGGGEFEVVRSGNTWTIVKPTPTRGDRQAIDQFLKALDELQTSNYPTKDAVPDPGLAKPSLILKVWQARDPREPSSTPPSDPRGELALNLRIGRRDSARKSIYAQIEGDPTVLALPDSAHDFLPRSSLAFRDRQVLAESTDQIRRIKVIGETRKFALNAPALKFNPFGNGPLGWWMVEPVDAPADADSVGMLLKLLANLRADSLVAAKADDLQPFGLKSPTLTLTWSNFPQFSLLRTAPGPASSPGTITLEDHSLLVGGPVPGRANVRYAKLADRPLIFTVGPDILGILDLEWRDRHVLALNPKHVRKAQLDWPERGLTLDATPSGNGRTWSFTGPVDVVDFDPGQVETLLKATSNLTTTRYVQHLGDFPQKWGLATPRLSIRFDLDDGSLPRTLKLGASAGRGEIFATTEKELNGPIFLIPEALIAPWLKPPRHHDDLPENVFAPR